MNEVLKPNIEIPKIDLDREVRQVTHRSYEKYLRDLFNLPENNLAKIDTVVDIGAGFSTFSEEARNKFKGLRAIAIDPAYKSIKSNPNTTFEKLQQQDKNVYLDFDPSYRDEEAPKDLDLYHTKEAEIFDHFVKEVRNNPDDYIDASHQNLPLDDNSTDLVLASNSIIRPENKPQIIKKAIQECLRILKKDGELRIAGNMACFDYNSSTCNAELWYNGTLAPGGSWAKEFEETGHYTDSELMKVLVDFENDGVNFYCVIASTDKDGETKHRFDTLILRKDNEKPAILIPKSDEVKCELRKMQFAKTDGFNIPTEKNKLEY